MRHLLAVLLVAPTTLAADWPQFRGSGGSTADALPTEWSRVKGKKPDARKAAATGDAADKNIAWTADLPGSGWAQPVVVGDKVFVAAVVTNPPHVPPNAVPKDVTAEWVVVCLALESGKHLWTKTAAAGKPKYTTHPGNTFATETPCADAERVYAFFGHAGVVAAFDHKGEEQWKADVGQFSAGGNGLGASPALHDGKLFIPQHTDQKGEVLCLDAKSGKVLWKATRPKGGASWASLLVWKNSARTELVVCGHGLVTGHDLADGKELWRMGGQDGTFYASPTAGGDVLAFGTTGGKGLLTAVKAGAKGDISLKDGETSGEFVLYAKQGSAPHMASPLAADGFLYVPHGGSLACYDLTTGKQHYKESLKGARQVVASPLLAGGHLYLTDEGGKTFVVKAGPEFELVAANPLDDMVWACAAAAGDRLLVRGVKGLYCIKK